MIIAVFLVSLVVLGLATAFISLMRINRANAEQQRVDHAVDNIAEQLKAVSYDYDGSSNDRRVSYSNELGLTLSPGPATDRPVVTLTTVECRTAGGSASDDQYNDCSAGDAGTQRVTIEGEFRDRSRSAQVVVRRR